MISFFVIIVIIMDTHHSRYNNSSSSSDNISNCAAKLIQNQLHHINTISMNNNRIVIITDFTLKNYNQPSMLPGKAQSSQVHLRESNLDLLYWFSKAVIELSITLEVFHRQTQASVYVHL